MAVLNPDSPVMRQLQLHTVEGVQRLLMFLVARYGADNEIKMTRTDVETAVEAIIARPNLAIIGRDDCVILRLTNNEERDGLLEAEGRSGTA